MNRTSSSEPVSALFERWEGVRQQIYAAQMQLADEVVSRHDPLRVTQLETSIEALDGQAQQLFAAAMRLLTDTPSANDAAPAARATRH